MVGLEAGRVELYWITCRVGLCTARDWNRPAGLCGEAVQGERRPQRVERAMSSNQGHGENPPSARPSMSAPPDQGPLALFDLYLRILSDSYLAFLQERFAHHSSLALLHLSSHLRSCLQEEYRRKLVSFSNHRSPLCSPLIYLKVMNPSSSFTARPSTWTGFSTLASSPRH